MTELYLYRFVMICLLIAAMLFGVQQYGDYRVQQFLAQQDHSLVPVQPIAVPSLHPPQFVQTPQLSQLNQPQFNQPLPRFNQPEPQFNRPLPLNPNSGAMPGNRVVGQTGQPVHVMPPSMPAPLPPFRGKSPGASISQPSNRPGFQLETPVGTQSVTPSKVEAGDELSSHALSDEIAKIQRAMGGSQIAKILGDELDDAENIFASTIEKLNQNPSSDRFAEPSRSIHVTNEKLRLIARQVRDLTEGLAARPFPSGADVHDYARQTQQHCRNLMAHLQDVQDLLENASASSKQSRQSSPSTKMGAKPRSRGTFELPR